MRRISAYRHLEYSTYLRVSQILPSRQDVKMHSAGWMHVNGFVHHMSVVYRTRDCDCTKRIK